jgi:hypothetical protein
MRTVTTIATLATLALLTAMEAACGDDGSPSAAPVLSNLKAPDTFTRGALNYGTVLVTDPDGLGGLQMHLRMIGTATMPMTTTPVSGVDDTMTALDVSFSLTPTPTTPIGPYTFYISVSDAQGNTSNELNKPIVVD